MEKRPKKTLTHTLRWATSCLKLALIAVLSLPGLVATGYIPRHYKTIEPSRTLAYAIERPRPRELVKIFCIVQANRPDLFEKDAWDLAEVILAESSKYKLDPILILAVIDVNIKLGTYYLHDLRKSFQNVNNALIAYNLGPTELRIRMEKQIEYNGEYANAVLTAYQRFKKIKLPTL